MASLPTAPPARSDGAALLCTASGLLQRIHRMSSHWRRPLPSRGLAAYGASPSLRPTPLRPRWLLAPPQANVAFLRSRAQPLRHSISGHRAQPRVRPFSLLRDQPPLPCNLSAQPAWPRGRVCINCYSLAGKRAAAITGRRGAADVVASQALPSQMSASARSWALPAGHLLTPTLTPQQCLCLHASPIVGINTPCQARRRPLPGWTHPVTLPFIAFVGSVDVAAFPIGFTVAATFQARFVVPLPDRHLPS